MMKINFKQFGATALLIVGVYSINPLVVLAQDNKNNSVEKDVFCDKLFERAEQVEKQITQRQDQIIGKQTEANYTLELNRQQRDQLLENKRKEWEQERLGYYKNLESQAVTSQQKQAVVVFQQTIERAIKNRELALDTAMENFRNSLDQIVEIRQGAVNTAVGVYKAGYQAAIAKARDDCNKGTATNLIRKSFNNNLQKARQDFLDDKQALEKQNIQIYINARDYSIQGALASFQQ
ncbi:MAG: hypothetical protein NTV62_01755, partial [Candidatus Gribaldobacteria bacterium]|nr:hypothetical protein [Candidatus Gribaldobacteria bacterium]